MCVCVCACVCVCVCVCVGGERSYVQTVHSFTVYIYVLDFIK